MSNLLRALRPENVTVTILGGSWTLTGRTAHDWIGSIGWDIDSLSGVLPGMLDAEQSELMLPLSMQHPDIEQRWLHAARVAVGRAGGRDWWWSVNLVTTCLQGWPYINGLLLHQGVNSHHSGLADWLDAAYMLLWGRADEKDRALLDVKLSTPPRNVAPGKQATRKMLEAFAAD